MSILIKGIEWFAFAWDLKSQYLLHQLDLKYNKIESGMIIYEDFFKEVAFEGRHFFISTGMTMEKDISKAVVFSGLPIACLR